MPLDSGMFAYFAFRYQQGKFHTYYMINSCSTTCQPNTSRASHAVFEDQQVKIRSWLAFSLAALQRRRGLLSVQPGLLKNFKD